MKGRYIIKRGSEIISESENIITTDGMYIIRTYLAGGVSDWAGALSVGSMNSTAPTISDRSLEFESIRVPIILKSVDGNEIIISATLPSEFNGKIYEVGLYPSVLNISSLGFDDRLLVNFDETWYDESGQELGSSEFSSTSRLGSRSLDLSNTNSYGQANIDIDLSGYSSLDSISILYNVDVSGSPRSVTLTFEDDQLPNPGYRTGIISLPGNSTGYKTHTELIGNFTDYNNFNNSVSRIIISASDDPSSAEIKIDAIRINDADEKDPLFALVSRSLIGTVDGDSTGDYVIKNPGVEVDIEYRLQIS